MNGRIISKQIHVRVEHVSPSKCRDEMKRRVKENEAAKKAAREGGGQWFIQPLSLNFSRCNSFFPALALVHRFSPLSCRRTLNPFCPII